MDFSTWFRAWLWRHPLNAPATLSEPQYTTEVMARVRRLASTPSASTAAVTQPLVWGWPRLVLSAMSVAAGVVLTVGLVRHSREQTASGVAQDTEFLAQLGKQPESLLADDPDNLAGELEAVDETTIETMTLAESTPDDEAWLEQTLQVLDQMDQDAVPQADTSERSSEDDWIDELQLLDESELASNV